LFEPPEISCRAQRTRRWKNPGGVRSVRSQCCRQNFGSVAQFWLGNLDSNQD
jgi:hypothetical protein